MRLQLLRRPVVMSTESPEAISLSPRDRWRARLWLAAILVIGFALVFALEFVLPRISFPFVDPNVSGARIAAPWVALIVALVVGFLPPPGRSRVKQVVLGGLLFIPTLGLGAQVVHALNAVGDRSTPQVVRYVVTGITYGKAESYAELAPAVSDPGWPPLEAHLGPWTPEPATGDTLLVRVRSGRLGYAWVERYGLRSEFGSR